VSVGRALALAWLAAVGLTGCEAGPGAASRDADAVRAVYASYRAAAAARDVEGLKRAVTRQAGAELTGPGAAAGLAALGAMDPATIAVRGITVEGGRAVVALTTPVPGGAGEGRVEMVKEDGAWKVAKESWEIKIGAVPGPPTPPPGPPPAPRPYEFERLLGAWKGPEVETGAEWTFTFSGAWDVSARGATGDEWLRGKAVSRMELGVEGGAVRVQPGGAVLDLDVTEAFRADYVGQTALGSYKLEGDRLTVCISKPGKLVRTSDATAPPRGVRCFRLAKAGR